MDKIYEGLDLTIVFFEEEIVRTSTGKDPFDDDYEDPVIGFGG